MSAECWICGGRGGSQVILRPDGKSDGRRLCRVCTRRLLVWLRALPADRRAALLAAVWPGAGSPEAAQGEPDVLAARAAFLESAAAAQPQADDAARLKLATGYLELGYPARALEALAAADAACVEPATDRCLTSLLSRLFHPGVLAPGAREALERALYPGPTEP